MIMNQKNTARPNNSRPRIYKKRVNMMFPMEEDMKETLQAIPGIKDKFNAWVQSILNEQEL